MYRLRFHLYFFIFWLFSFLISLIFNIGIMGAFFGTLIALITDPVVLLFGIIIGLLFSTFRSFFTAFLFSVIAVNLIVEFSLLGLHSEISYSRTYANLFFVCFVRSVALLMLAVLSNMIRVYFVNRKMILK